MGSADEDFGTGRSKHTGVGELFKSGGTGISFLAVGYVGDKPPHEMGPGRVPA